MEKPEGFEITEYGQDHEIPGRVQGVILEIIEAMTQENPALGVRVTFTGSLMRLTYSSYEMFLSQQGRIQEVQRICKMTLDEAVKVLKKEFKSKAGETLSISEKKEMANYDVQKVSLNERYVFSSWRFYEIG